MKGKKIIVSALAATMVAAPIATLNSVGNKAYADTLEENYTVLGPGFSVSRADYPAKANKNKAVKFKAFTTSTTGEYAEVTVVDPLGKTVTVADDSESGYKTFTPNIAGVYTYKFKKYKGTGENNATQTSVASTYELTLTVSGDNGTIEMPENSYFVVPTEFKKGSKLSVPMPNCFVNDGEEKVDFEQSATKDGATIEAYLLKGSVKTPLTYVAGTGSDADKLAHFETAEALSETGTYKLVYQLKYADPTASGATASVVAVSNSKSIRVKESLTSTKLYASYATTPSKSAEAGAKYNLVELNVALSENSTNYVEAFTKITVKHIDSGELMDIDYDNMTFKPTKTGNYLVTYKAMIPSLGLESDELTYSIINVADTTQPVLYLTGDYKVDATTGKVTAPGETGKDLTDMDIDLVYDEIGDLSSNLKSYYQLSTDGSYGKQVTVKIPAAFVKDQFSGANKITVTRALYVSTNTTDTGKLKLVKADSSEYAYNEVAEYTFYEQADTASGRFGAGSYVVKYTATDETGNVYTSENFSITIKAYNSITNDSTTGKVNVPTVTFALDNETVKADGKLTFDAPTATDSYDRNLDTKVYYFADANSLNSTEVETKIRNMSDVKTLINANKNDDDKYVLDIEKAVEGVSGAAYVYVVAVSRNSYNNEKLELNRNFVVKKIKLIGGTDDIAAPTITGPFASATELSTAIVNANEGKTGTGTIDENGYIDASAKKAMFDQNETIVIPSMKFNDADANVNFTVKVSYVRNGKQVVIDATGNGFKHTVAESAGQYTHTISGASFTASYAKLYTVTVIAVDSNQNSAIVSFGIRVNDTEAPAVYVVNESKFAKTLEYGDTFTIPAPTIYDDGEVDENGTWTWSVKFDDKFIKENTPSEVREFTPAKAGTYVIIYNCKDAAGNVAAQREYTLNVKATVKPEIELAWVMDSYDFDWDSEASTQNEINIPMASAKDKYFADAIIVGAPKVTDGKGDEVAVTTDTTTNSYKFTPKTQGKYTVTYYALSEKTGLSQTKVVTLNVGDTNAPTMEWTNKETDLKQTVSVGDKWTFKFDMIKVEDDNDDLQKTINDIIASGVSETSLKNLKDYATITMTKDGKAVSYEIIDNGLQYTFDSTGDYTFKIEMKDRAGNSTGTEYTYTITAKEVEKEETKKDNKIGTILIVLSVVILAGVVTYFVVTTKKVDKKAVESKDKKDKKNKK